MMKKKKEKEKRKERKLVFMSQRLTERKKTKREGNLPNLDGFYKKGSFLEHSTENRLFFYLGVPKRQVSSPFQNILNFRST